MPQDTEECVHSWVNGICEICKEECVHHWDVDAAEGPTSSAICRKCEHVTQFLNYLEEYGRWNNQEPPLERDLYDLNRLPSGYQV